MHELSRSEKDFCEIYNAGFGLTQITNNIVDNRYRQATKRETSHENVCASTAGDFFSRLQSMNHNKTCGIGKI